MTLRPDEFGLSTMHAYTKRKERLAKVKDFIEKAKASNREKFNFYATFFYETDGGKNTDNGYLNHALGEVIADLMKSNDTFFNAAIDRLEKDVAEAAVEARKEALAIIEETNA